uniref:hypothetical protein n=1 Tax=Neisseria lactamica TaxID=486 RepID=UPI001C3F5404
QGNAVLVFVNPLYIEAGDACRHYIKTQPYSIEPISARTEISGFPLQTDGIGRVSKHSLLLWTGKPCFDYIALKLLKT